MHPEEHLRAEVVRVSRAVHDNGWVANHDGNVSARLGEGRFLATPTATSKGAVRPEHLIVVDGEGQRLQGTRGSFSELKLHLAVYRRRPDVGAVLHAHPPTATGFAVAGASLEPPFMAEPVVSLGRWIPTVPFGLPGDPALDDALNDALGRAQVILLGNHGVLAVGPDPDLCLLRMELVEHLAKIALAARQLGGPRPLDEALVSQLHAKHRKLFPIDGETEPAGGPAPASHATPGYAAPTPSAWSGGAASIVSDALKRFG